MDVMNSPLFEILICLIGKIWPLVDIDMFFFLNHSIACIKIIIMNRLKTFCFTMGNHDLSHRPFGLLKDVNIAFFLSFCC